MTHDDSHFYGSIETCWFHVLGYASATPKQVGRYCVSLRSDVADWVGISCPVFMAVVDDFGNLVRVPS